MAFYEPLAVWAIVATVLAIVLVLVLRRRIRVLEGQLAAKQTGAYQMGMHQTLGDLSQVLGTFAVLAQYDDLIFLSTSSRQASLDLLGITPDELHFIELKKKGAPLGKAERKVRQLIDDKKVRYVVMDVELPAGAEVGARPEVHRPV